MRQKSRAAQSGHLGCPSSEFGLKRRGSLQKPPPPSGHRRGPRTQLHLGCSATLQMWHNQPTQGGHDLCNGSCLAGWGCRGYVHTSIHYSVRGIRPVGSAGGQAANACVCRPSVVRLSPGLCCQIGIGRLRVLGFRASAGAESACTTCLVGFGGRPPTSCSSKQWLAGWCG